jgi:SOS-response transcriptional repressor LexA
MSMLRKAAERYAQETGTRLTVVEDPRTPLTDRQREIYDFIASRFRATQQAPSLREVMRRFEFASTNAVVCHLKSIEKKGWIELGGKAKSRAVKILPVAGCCPLCGAAKGKADA